MKLPDNVHVLDLSKNNHLEQSKYEYSIGKYNEKRPGMYLGDHYEKTARDIHMGIDIGAPVGTPIYSFYDGEIFLFCNNNGILDYGFTLITKHRIKNIDSIETDIGPLSFIVPKIVKKELEHLTVDPDKKIISEQILMY